jgi:Arc/MetJ-type ribon-helix-helix transcriptional regulator
MARTAVKIAISLPKARVEHLRAIQTRERKSLSAVVDQALADWLKRREHAEMEQQYREYCATEASHTALASQGCRLPCQKADNPAAGAFALDCLLCHAEARQENLRERLVQFHMVVQLPADREPSVVPVLSPVPVTHVVSGLLHLREAAVCFPGLQ